jgi:hypothetical protein
MAYRWYFGVRKFRFVDSGIVYLSDLNCLKQLYKHSKQLALHCWPPKIYMDIILQALALFLLDIIYLGSPLYKAPDAGPTIDIQT